MEQLRKARKGPNSIARIRFDCQGCLTVGVFRRHRQLKQQLVLDQSAQACSVLGRQEIHHWQVRVAGLVFGRHLLSAGIGKGCGLEKLKPTSRLKHQRNRLKTALADARESDTGGKPPSSTRMPRAWTRCIRTKGPLYWILRAMAGSN